VAVTEPGFIEPEEGVPGASLGKVFRNWAEVAADASAELESIRAIGKFMGPRTRRSYWRGSSG
jgi:hypothetical protein